MNKSAKHHTQTMVMLGLLVALEIIFTRFFAIRTPIVTIGFGFVPVSLAAMMYGPLKGGIVGGLADFIGATLFPIGAYFPGFTLTAFMTGLIFGVFLYGKPVKLPNVVIAVSLVGLVCSLTLDTYWLYLITGKGILALLPVRLMKAAVMIPVQIAVIQLVGKLIYGRIRIRFQSV